MTTPPGSQASSFDFHAYLLDLTGAEWDIEELSGGNANHVVRATQVGRKERDDATTAAHDLLRHHSVVLKQAPPYFAKFPDFQFSQRRQTIEARALRLLHGGDSVSDSLRDLLGNVEVPQLVHHDEGDHVLIQSDLGAHPTLNEFLSSTSTTSARAASAGKSLGKFLGSIHAFSPDPTLAKTFINEDGENVMYTVIENVSGFLRDAGAPDYASLAKIALEHWKARKRTAFSQGDIWFGTVLVDDNPESSLDDGQRGTLDDGQQTAPAVKICDWEFAGPNDPAADIAQLGAYLHLSTLSTLESAPQPSIVHAFASALYGSYLSALLSSRSDTSRQEFQRSLLIMHGWELVNAAAWRHELWCRCSGTGVKCQHIADMVLQGARLLRAAGHPGGGVDWKAVRAVSWFSAAAHAGIFEQP
ncbi:hypothetical protein BV25DRAFT_1913939 [Artomyces pyxidatus]|uniref:Uncharacterized protein n=1 Tax=Artomyces pyxidatus TaxID=48021 RepID=A0ACB8T7K6_9AGAM|nr:hypothetical protein BV25DRAFT_1913939 [Artomyces pyxidatus]